MENKKNQRLEKLKIGVIKYCDELLKIANELERKNPNAERYYDILRIHNVRYMILMMIDIDDSEKELKAFESRQKKLKKKRDKEEKPVYIYRPGNKEELIPVDDDDDLPF